ncbi:hypothetical protein [Dyadobacter luticola]|uniref:Uncharacterized protein n=1 Tax=Dyadobacter luticola TaxID=1979387 RepID=A0A5R9KSC6_9BACT|nr:hypothetical protein [Dyadobacter luticola]TLU98986.1 hypothetical protein FEN17_20585 [Dyadobacter luticola]
MKKNLLFLFLAITAATLSQSTFAQVSGKIVPDKQRATQWKPAVGQYYFSHALVFDYQNKADKTSGQLKVYIDPVTGAMCFRKESSFGQGGKTFDFVIGFPDGKYIFCGTDGGKKVRINEVVKELKPDAETKAQQKSDFETYAIPTGNKRVDFGMESLEYDLSYATSDNKDKIWLTKTPFSVYPLYGIEFVESAVSLPVTFDYMHLLTANQLLSEINSKDLVLKLTDIVKEPFTAITKGYTVLKLE